MQRGAMTAGCSSEKQTMARRGKFFQELLTMQKKNTQTDYDINPCKEVPKVYLVLLAFYTQKTGTTKRMFSNAGN